MAVEGKMSVIKYLMFFFNFLFWLSGLALIIVGGIISHNYGDYLSFADKKFATAATFIIIVGVIVFIIGFLGCCGAIKENYCMVTTFAVLLGIIFVLEVVAGILGFVYRGKVKKAATDALNRAVEKYPDEKGAKKMIDWAQQRFECCGNQGPTDYKNGTVPASCCKDKVNPCVTPYTEGCAEKFEAFIRHNLVVIGAVAIAIAFMQLLGIIFACCLMKAIKGEYEVV